MVVRLLHEIGHAEFFEETFKQGIEKIIADLCGRVPRRSLAQGFECLFDLGDGFFHFGFPRGSKQRPLLLPTQVFCPGDEHLSSTQIILDFALFPCVQRQF